MDKVSRYLAGIGKKGGLQRATNLTAKQRTEIAQKAAAARWGKSPATKRAAGVPR